MRYKFEKLKYRDYWNADNNEVGFKFLQNSQYFIEASNFLKLQLVKHILHQFSLKQTRTNILIFNTNPSAPQQHPDILVQQLASIIETYQVCILEQDHQTDKNISYLNLRLRSRCGKASFKNGSINDINLSRKYILYFRKEYKQIIQQQIQRYDSMNCMKMVFSLNQYLTKDIEEINYLKITEIFKEQFQTELKALPLRCPYFEKDQIEILSVNQKNILRQDIESQQLTKSQYVNGLFGLELQIAGKQFCIPLIYNLVNKFFYKVKFVIKNSKDITINPDNIQEYLKGKGITAYLMKLHQILIIDPPINLQDIFYSLKIKIWVISQADFLHHDFSLIKKHEQIFLSRFRQLKLQCQIIKIQPNKMQLKCLSNIYSHMMSFCKQFLFDMLQKQYPLNFFASPFQLQIFKQFYSDSIAIANVQLRWAQSKAKVICYSKDQDTVYNKINQLYQQMKKSLIKTQSKIPINHKLVNSYIKTIPLHYLPYFRYKLKKYHLIVQLKPFEEIFKEQFGIFFFTSFNKCTKLHEILQLNTFNTQNTFKYAKIQLSINNCQQLKNLITLKLPKRLQDKIYEIEQRITYLMMNNRPFNIVLSQDYSRYMEQFMAHFIERLVFRSESRQYFQDRIVKLFIAGQDRKHQSIIIQNLNDIFRTNQDFLTLQHYNLDQPQIKRIMITEPIKITIKKIINQQKCVKTLHPLISYVFYYQTQQQTKMDHEIAIFPNKTGWDKFLVNLRTLQIFQITKQASYKIIIDSMTAQFQSLVKYLQKQFPKQSYIVITYKKKQHKILPQFYVYSKTKARQLIQKQILMMDGKIKIKVVNTIQYVIDKKQAANIYMLETHRQFLPTLQQIIEKGVE